MRSKLALKYQRLLFVLLFWAAAVLLLELPPPSEFALASPSSRVSRNDPRQTLAIVVNRANPVDNLSFVELRKIFLGERGHWSNGHRVIVIMMEPGSWERDMMLRDVFRMKENTYRDYVLRQSYTGDLAAPSKTLSSPEIVRKFVFNSLGSIGYLRASDVTDAVKVITIDGHVPQDPAYRLQGEGPAK